MCQFFEVSRSGYYDFLKRFEKTERDADLAKKIEECQKATDKTYGYRRVWLWLESQKIRKNPKTVLRIMKKYGLLSEIRRRRKWVNLGQQLHKYENLLNWQFRADRPNIKWVTDKECTALKKITIPSGVREIGESCFRGCSQLESVEFRSNQVRCSDKVLLFDGCSKLTAAVLPSEFYIYMKFRRLFVDSKWWMEPRVFRRRRVFCIKTWRKPFCRTVSNLLELTPLAVATTSAAL